MVAKATDAFDNETEAALVNSLADTVADAAADRLAGGRIVNQGKHCVVLDEAERARYGLEREP